MTGLHFSNLLTLRVVMPTIPMCLIVLLSSTMSLLIFWHDWATEWSRSVMSLCNPMDCSLPGSFIHGIFQARIPEWVAIPFSRGSSRPRDWTRSPALQAEALPSEPPGRLYLLAIINDCALCMTSLKNVRASMGVKSHIIQQLTTSFVFISLELCQHSLHYHLLKFREVLFFSPLFSSWSPLVVCVQGSKTSEKTHLKYGF